MAKQSGNSGGGGNGNLWSGIAQGAMAIGGGLLGSASGKKNQKRQHEYNKEIMEIQNKYLNEQNETNYKLQKKFWEDTNYPAEVEQMKKAGLNVGLMYEGAGAGGTTMNGLGSGMPSGGGNYSDLGMSAKGMDIGAQTAQALANIELTKAQAENVKADTENKTGVDKELKEAQISDITQGIENKKALETGQKLENRLKELQVVYDQETLEDRMKGVQYNTSKALSELNIMAREDKFSAETYSDRVKIVTNSILESQVRQIVGKAQAENLSADTGLKKVTTELSGLYAKVALMNAESNRTNANTGIVNAGINQQNADSVELKNAIDKYKAEIDKALRTRGLDQQGSRDAVEATDKLINQIWKAIHFGF